MLTSVRTEPTGFNVFSHRTFCNGLFKVSLPRELAADFWQHHRLIRPNVGKTGDVRDNHLTVREALHFIEYCHFVHYNVVISLISYADHRENQR